MDANFRNLISINNALLPYHMWLKNSKKTTISATTHTMVRNIYDDSFDGRQCQICLTKFNVSQSALNKHMAELHKVEPDGTPLSKLEAGCSENRKKSIYTTLLHTGGSECLYLCLFGC